MSQTTRNQVPITAQKDLRLRVVGIDEQVRFANVREQCRQMFEHLRSALREAEDAFSSLSQRAFRGELSCA